MYIKAYHGRIQEKPLWAGVDASVYGCIKQSIKTPSFFFPQASHIHKSLSGHVSPEKFIATLKGRNAEPTPSITQYLQEGLDIANALPWLDRGGQASRWDCAIIYALAKSIQPDRIIETGTGTGATGYCALRGAQGAVLHTFDMEEEGSGDDGVPYKRWADLPRNGVGQFIGEEMEDSVRFILGDIRQTLPQWVASENSHRQNPDGIDLVILDSAHTPEQQVFEAETLAPLMTKGSVMLCDDTTYGWGQWSGSNLNCGFLGGIRIDP
jgi:predicted O-methyltransferase YrrM